MTQNVDTGINPYVPPDITVGDFNGDGIPDMAIVASGLTILLGKGDGTYTALPMQSLSFTSRKIAAADFNGDGKLDLVLGDYQESSLMYFAGNGDGTFGAPMAVPSAGENQTALAVADLNGDGIPDIIVVNGNDSPTTSTLTAMLGSGNGTFTALPSYPAPEAVHVATGDFNGDGFSDLALGASDLDLGTFAGANSINVLLTDSQSAAAMVTAIAVPGAGTHQIAASYAGDVDMDNDPSVSGTVALVGQRVPTVDVIASASPTTFGKAETFTATVSGAGATPTGTLSFFDGSTKLGSATLNPSGAASLSTADLAVGSHSITVQFAGDSNYSSATSASISVKVNKAMPTVALKSSTTSTTIQMPVTLTATVSGVASRTPRGIVVFYDSTTELGYGTLNSSGVATFSTSTLAVGSHTITAAYQGDTNYVPATSAASTVTVGPEAAITSPAPGSQLTGPSTNFTWSAPPGATAYKLWLGSTGVDSHNLYSGASTTANSVTVTLPTNGETIYARLFTENSGTWTSLNSTYTAATQAVLTAPAAGGKVTGPTMKFTWTAANPTPTAYQLWVGTTGVGSNNVYSSGAIAATSATVGHLPTTGTVYVRLYTEFGSTWVHTDLTFQAQ